MDPGKNRCKYDPLFQRHQQPHLPGELGFYDLRVPEVREAQAALAQERGICGFCYYHYWFHGKRLLERPFEEVLSSRKPGFPFCLCRADENWTRAWDGRDQQVMIEQTYSQNDDRAHIRTLMPAFKDERHIRIHGKRVFLVYRAEELPDPARTAEIWREEAHRAGIGELFLASVESFAGGVDPRSIGFDAAVEFAPPWHARKLSRERNAHRVLSKIGLLQDVYRKHRIIRYENLAARMLSEPFPDYLFFRCPGAIHTGTSRYAAFRQFA